MNTNPIVQVRNITKIFPGVKALDNVSIDFYPGKVHALCGENGAGKSTLIKVISGVYEPTSGEMEYQGQPVHFKTPGQALEAGISVIHQELSVANDLTVSENIFLGVEPKKRGFLDRKKMDRSAQEVLDSMEVDIRATQIVGSLSAAQQQMVEIAKVITKKSKIVIMDEPTSSLSEAEIAQLFDQIRILKKNNIAVIYITHRMKELFIVCDEVTVLRDGMVVRHMNIADTTETEIVTSMVGREIKDYYNKHEHTRGKEMLRVEGLTRKGVFEDISFTAYQGEILGIAGLVGAKRTDVFDAIFAATRADEGKVFLDGEEVQFKTPRDAIAHKVGYVTEDRRRTGLMLDAKIKDNIVLPSLIQCCRKLGILDEKWEKEVSNEYMGKLAIKAPGIQTMISTLSGGNQQKVILAKWLVAKSRVLLLDEPTRGIDVNAKSEFYALMNAFVENGGTIVMVSSEMPEIIGVSDRVIVMHEGHINGELQRSQINEQNIIKMISLQNV